MVSANPKSIEALRWAVSCSDDYHLHWNVDDGYDVDSAAWLLSATDT